MFISHFNLQLKVFITIVPIAEILKKKMTGDVLVVVLTIFKQRAFRKLVAVCPCGTVPHRTQSQF